MMPDALRPLDTFNCYLKIKLPGALQDIVAEDFLEFVSHFITLSLAKKKVEKAIALSISRNLQIFCGYVPRSRPTAAGLP